MAIKDSEAQFIDVADLRIGLYVYLDLGWMKHPFALNNFKITSRDQIDTILQLGINRIRWSPEKSDPEPAPDAPAVAPTMRPKVGADATAYASGGGNATQAAEDVQTAAEAAAEAAVEEQRRQRRELLASQRESLDLCERQFANAGRAFRQTIDAVRSQPAVARQQAEQAVGHMVGKLLEQEESAIRLLSENVGEKASLHSINVTTISLLLGKALGYDADQLNDLGIGALLHDIGKIRLPERLRWKDDNFNKAERHLYEEHVIHGIEFARAMDLSPAATTIIAQHHEFADGRGYPRKLAGDAIAPLARVVGLVNHYDTLCNPSNPAQAITPHEALSLIFAQMKKQFDIGVLMPFIRMMGVYPPGSVVELSDGRHALVVSVNSSRPLKPRIVIHDPHVPRDEALVVDLEDVPELGIRRSLKPVQLPTAAFSYLSPRSRICYFFERARCSSPTGEDPA
jgi:putative nucleotidyltransferase with HDIG domain